MWLKMYLKVVFSGIYLSKIVPVICSSRSLLGCLFVCGGVSFYERDTLSNLNIREKNNSLLPGYHAFLGLRISADTEYQLQVSMCVSQNTQQRQASPGRHKGERRKNSSVWGERGLDSVGQCNVCVMGVGGLWCAHGCGVWYVCLVCSVWCLCSM